MSRTVEIPLDSAIPKKSDFIDIVKMNVHRDGIDKLLDYMETNGFFEAPASTKYHGNYKGGLFTHSLNVYYDLKDELQMIYGSQWPERYSLETVTIVSLFHDICKIDKYVETTRNVKDKDTGEWKQVDCFEYNNDQVRLGHGSASVYILSDFIKLTPEEKQAIHFHMGAFDISPYNSTYDLGNAFNRNTLAFALHIADMTATYIDENEYFRPAGED